MQKVKGKKVLFGTEARRQLAEGVNILGDAVRSTLGPKGKLAVINPNAPIFTRDGVTVANEIELEENTPQNSGAKLVRSVARKTNEEAGDGTTTATILMQELLKEGLRGVEMGIDPMKIRESWEDAKPLILKELKNNSREVKGKADVANAATISSRDAEMGRIISEVYEKVGVDGVVTVEGTNTVGLSYELVDGMEVDRGWVSPYFITNADKMEANLEDAHILVTSQAIGMNDEITRALEMIANTDKKTLVIFADDVKGEALATTILNRVRGILRVAVVRAPEHGDAKADALQDIATITGATLIGEHLGTNVDAIEMEQFGYADRVIIQKGRTIIVGGKGKKKEITDRVNTIKKQMDAEENKWRKETLKKRYARMRGGIGVIKIGCASEAEQKEKRFLLEDAVNTAKSAMEEGIVIGAGLALYNASKVLDKKIKVTTDADYRFGLQAMQKALQAPARQVLENAGCKVEVILSEIDRDSSEAGNKNMGYDANLGIMWRDLFEQGIIDPLKVERVALENSISVTGMFLITGMVITDIKNDNDNDTQED